MRWLVAMALLAACQDKQTDNRAAASCDQGHAADCMAATAGLDYTNAAELRKAMGYWRKGCRLQNGPSCAQLGTVAEFGMESGGKAPDRVRAIQYYDLACQYGDAKSCERAGHPVAPDAPPPFAWDAALAPIVRGHAEIGPLFDGLVPGEPMPPDVQKRVDDFKQRFHAHVNYDKGDRDLLSGWSLDIMFDEQQGSREAISRTWGPLDLAWGAWTNERAHLIAVWMHGDHGSGIGWREYHSPTEVIAPDDKTKLGFEPIPLIGAKLDDLRKALDGKILRSAEDEYRFETTDAGEVRVVVAHDVITAFSTQNWFTNDPAIGDRLFDLLAAKWGPPRLAPDGSHTWVVGGRRVKASKPAAGNFAMEVTKR